MSRNVVEVGQILSGKYKLLRLLGDGGMGSVYEAEHQVLGTHVAIKVLHADLSRRAGLIDRFLQEARVSAQIRSPHVVRVTDMDRTSDGVAYLVMDLLEGEPLANVIRRERQLSLGTASAYTVQILQALGAAHALGVIHRDLKPDNVFVTFEGGKPVLKLIDFGIAKLKQADGGTGKNLTVAGMLMGTPEYMAPEQAYAADKVDVRADLYAVGAMLYEMLSGQTPVSGEDPRVVVLKVERGEVTPLVQLVPGVPPELAGFVHRAMAPRPELRFANAAEMRLALESVMAGKRVGTAQLAVGQPRPAEPAGSTMMGAPTDAALAQPAGGGTVRAAPIDPSALRPIASPTPSYEMQPTPAPRRRAGTGLVVGLAAVALLLGAGAVVTYVLSNEPSHPVVPDPFATETATASTSTAPASATATGATTTPATVVTTATPLAPPPVIPVTPPPPRPSGSTSPPHPSASAAPSTTGPLPPFVLPSGLPTTLPPFPAGFPSGLPSGFALPSGFPPLFPPQPPPSPP